MNTDHTSQTVVSVEYTSFIPYEDAVTRLRLAKVESDLEPIDVQQTQAPDGMDARFKVSRSQFARYYRYGRRRYRTANIFNVYLRKVEDKTQVYIGAAEDVNLVLSLFIGTGLAVAAILIIFVHPLPGIILGITACAGWFEAARRSKIGTWSRKWVQDLLPPLTPPPQ